MVWNLEEGSIALYHCALDGKAMDEDTEGPQHRLWERRKGRNGGGAGKHTALMTGALLSNL